jgi:YD repeat-containing protein
MVVSHVFDPVGQDLVLYNVTHAGVALAIFTAGYDPVGNRTSVIELDGTRVTFGYDALYQLINEQRSGVNGYNTTYGYDPTSNRSLKNGALTNYTYNLANELILIQPPTGQPTTNQWDGAGNLSVDNTVKRVRKLRGEPPVPPDDETLAAFRAALAAAMPPEDVAAALFQAVREDRFYINTHLE